MKLFTIDNSGNKSFVTNVFSFVSATNRVLEKELTSEETYTWILQAGDKNFKFLPVADDQWMEI